MSGEKKGIVKKAKDLVNKARKTVKKIINTIKFFMTPLGTVLGWLLLIILAVILLYVVVNIVATAFKEWLGINTDYTTYDKDLQVIQDLYASGYASQVDPENFVNFKAFEYAVLLDASEYIRIQGQEKFSIVKNQGLYKKESEWLSDKLAGNEEYIESLKEPETPAIKLVSTISETDQSHIAEGVLKGIIEKATGMRNIDVVKELGRESKEKETLGGNNRVSGPFLVYEFVYSELAKKTASSKDKSSSTSNETAANSTEGAGSTENTNSTEGTGSSENTGSTEGTNPTETTGSTEGTNVTEATNTTESTNNSTTNESEGISYNENPTTALDKFSSGELGGSLIPYIYVIREEIDYDFYFDENDEAIKIPLLLNAYNTDLGLSAERTKEAKRAMGGISVRVWPDLDASGDYTWVPYYTDETNKTIYKIPLKTLIGRYMPRTELLHTWTLLQQDIAQNNSFEQEDKKLQIINEVTDKIKQLYSEVCLEGEGTTTHQETVTEKKVNEENKIEDVTNTYTYTEDLTNTKSFVTFQKAGIETTRYIDFKDDAKKVTYVADFIPAYLVGEEFSISYKPGNSNNSGFTSVDVEGTVGEMSGGKQGKINMKLSEISVPNLSKTEFISGYGNEKDGYAPPSNLHQKVEGYLYTGGANIEGIKHAILMAACKNKGIDPTSATIDVEVKFNPIFVTDEFETAKALEIEHRRMPILLVKSAITWAREIEYTHVIKQEMFEPTDPSYLVPNCVSSMGIHSFTTSENSGAYRGMAYEEIFGCLQEKNVVSMLLNLETFADQGIEDCYEYMRELYKLVMASQNYSQTKTNGKKYIHPGTYTYVYLQNSILYYNDRQSQAIYWQELLGQRGPVDALLKDEVENVRSRDPDIKWQILEYNKYKECEGKVYALNPYGSGYVRAYQQQAKTQNPDDPDINGAYSPGSHEGADLYGRNRIDSMLQQGESATDDYVSVTRKIYNYGLKQLESIYTPQKAKEYFIKKLKEEQSYMPVVAVAPGKVEGVGFNGRSGFCVSILHDNEGTSTLYCHLKRWPNVAAGDYIGAGTVIGYEGNTGRSGGTHLHFEIHKPNSPEEVENPDTNTVDPQYYIFPTFNPFYYEEKIAEEGLSLSSEYMTLYRTVYMADISDEKKIKSGDLKSSKPDCPLLQNANNLILEQGRKELKINMTGSLGWAKEPQNDLYIREEFFDINLAREKGLLDVDPDFWDNWSNDYIVNTDVSGPNRLPVLTREELEYILENWLSDRYSKEEFEWLMKNVFTEDTITKILEAQEKYKVSAVFALAVGAYEQQLGLADGRAKAEGEEAPLGRPDICNIFSIKGTVGGGFYFNNVMWNKYSSYGEAFEAFARLIAGNTYFGAGLYSVKQIGPIYCEESDEWIRNVTDIIKVILGFYTGNDFSTPSNGLWFGSQKKLLNVINMMMAWMNRGGGLQFYYCGNKTAGFPPYGKSGVYIENFAECQPNRTSSICGQCSCADTTSPNYRAGDPVPRTHCSYYVNVCLWQCAKANHLDPNQYTKGGSDQWLSYGKTLVAKVTKGNPHPDDGVYQLVWYKKEPKIAAAPDAMEISNIERDIRPGDILVYENSNKGKMARAPSHVEFYVGAANDKASFKSIYRHSVSREETGIFEVYTNGLDKIMLKDCAYNYSEKGGTYLMYILRPKSFD